MPLANKLVKLGKLPGEEENGNLQGFQGLLETQGGSSFFVQGTLILSVGFREEAGKTDRPHLRTRSAAVPD